MTANLVASLLSSGQYSDFTIECQGQSFKVHKAIVCSQSPVIDAALRGDFKEAATNVVTISGFDAATVQRMLDFMYGVSDGSLGNEKPGKAPKTAPAEAASGAPAPTPQQPAAQPAAQAPAGPPTVPPAVPPAQPASQPASQPAATGEKAEPTGQTKPPSPGPREQQKKDLAAHVWTNAIADYYQVPALCDVASTLIVKNLQANWYPGTFLDVASLASSSTGDKQLHSLLTQLAADHVEELARYGDDRLAGLVALHDFPVRFTRYSADRAAELKSLVNTHAALVGTQAAENKKLKAEVKQLKGNNAWYSVEYANLKAENDKLKAENNKFALEVNACKSNNKAGYTHTAYHA